jgi:hypothetical protein
MRMPHSACHSHRRPRFARPSLAVVLLTVLALVGSGCTSMHTLRVAAPGALPTTTSVKPKDVVRVTMTDGRVAKFTVSLVEPSAIVATGGARYPTNEIAKLERQSVSAIKTSAAVVGGVMLLLLGVAAATFEPPTVW